MSERIMGYKGTHLRSLYQLALAIVMLNNKLPQNLVT